MDNRNKKITLLLGDILLFASSMMLTVILDGRSSLSSNYASAHFLMLLIIIPVWSICFFIEGLYSLRTFNRNGTVISLLRATIFSGLLSVILIYVFNIFRITPKTNLIIFSFISLVLTYLWRQFFFKLFSYDAFMRSVCFIGEAIEYEELKHLFFQKKYLGFKVHGHHACLTEATTLEGCTIIVIDDNKLSSDIVADKLFELMNSGKSVISMSDFLETVLGKVPVTSINHTWFLKSSVNFKLGSYHLLKPIFDKFLAVILLIFCIPFSFVIFPLLLITSGRPFFYSQKRVGLNGQEFTIFKLRSMRTDAEINGAQWASKNDSRITVIGGFLRKTRIDELPQLFNILNGTMSFVGPRPERLEIIRKKLELVIPFYNYRHLVKPGVTGWAQVNYGYGNSNEDSLIKLQYDLFYVRNFNIWLDLRIILKTFKIIINKLGN